MGRCEEMSTFPVMGSRYAGVLLQSVSIRVKLVMSTRGPSAGQAGLSRGMTLASPQSDLGFLRARND